MTPERIEEIKRENEELVKTLIRVPIPSLICASGQITELLAALEEAQLTIARQSEALGWYELGKPELAHAALGNKEGETQP